MDNIQIRVLIRSKGKLFKLFGAKDLTDYKGESYLKVIFPDSKNPDISVRFLGQNKREKGHKQELFNELSYHYMAGVRHLKYGSSRTSRKENLPDLHNTKAIHLFRFILHYLKGYQLHKGNPNEAGNLILDDFEVGESRVIDFSISVDGEAYPSFDQLKAKKWSVNTNEGKTICITDGIQEGECDNCASALPGNLISRHIYLLDDPGVKFPTSEPNMFLRIKQKLGHLYLGLRRRLNKSR